MIKIIKQAAPNVLILADGPADRERKLALAHFNDPNKKTSSFTFRVYKNSEVKSALNTQFNFKCAYCESKFGATAPVDIEHFRPKLAVSIENGTLLKPGYYWLAADWKNLLPSCIDCNRARIQDHIGQSDPQLSGKANLFPIEGDSRTDLHPGDEAGEKPLLVDPCNDDVEGLFLYDADKKAKVVIMKRGKVRGHRRKKAETSIQVYGLNRSQLAFERYDRYKRVSSQLDLVVSCIKTLSNKPANEEHQKHLALALHEFNALQEDAAPYAGMTRHLNLKTSDLLERAVGRVLGSRLKSFPGDTTIERLLSKFPLEEAPDLEAILEGL